MNEVNNKIDLLIVKFDQLIHNQNLGKTICKNDSNLRFKTFKPPRDLFFTGSWQPVAVLVNGLFHDESKSLVYYIITEKYVKFTHNIHDRPGRYIEADKLMYFIQNQTFLLVDDWNKALFTDIDGYFVGNPLTIKEVEDLKC